MDGGWLATDALWAAFVGESGNNDEDASPSKVRGHNRQSFNTYASRLFKNTTVRRRHPQNGQRERGWRGWVLTVGDSTREESAPEMLMDTPPPAPSSPPPEPSSRPEPESQPALPAGHVQCPRCARIVGDEAADEFSQCTAKSVCDGIVEARENQIGAQGQRAVRFETKAGQPTLLTPPAATTERTSRQGGPSIHKGDNRE